MIPTSISRRGFLAAFAAAFPSLKLLNQNARFIHNNNRPCLTINRIPQFILKIKTELAESGGIEPLR